VLARCLRLMLPLVRCAHRPLGHGSARTEAEYARLFADRPGIENYSPNTSSARTQFNQWP